MIKNQNPDYVLALPHITDYYDMRLVTFGLDDQGRLVVCFPIFIKRIKERAYDSVPNRDSESFNHRYK